MLTQLADRETQIGLSNTFQRVKEIEDQLRRELKGRTVEIISNYNGQPWGHSRKALTGKQYKIKSAFIEDDDVYLWLEGLRLSIHHSVKDEAIVIRAEIMLDDTLARLQ